MKIRGKNQGNSRNGFIIALICSVAFAFLFPSPGAKGGWMHPDLLNNAGVALILFLQGLAMAQLIFGGEPGIDPSADHVLSPVSVVRLRAACQSLFQPESRDPSRRGVSDRPTITVPLTH